MTKDWIIGDDLDLDNFIYVCISSLPINGNCSETNCPTYNYFNSPGPVSTISTKWSELEIFPNPVDFELILKHDAFKGNESVELFNSIGNSLKVRKEYTGKTIKISTSDLSKGLYFIRISDSNGAFPEVRRFMKM